MLAVLLEMLFCFQISIVFYCFLVSYFLKTRITSHFFLNSDLN